MELRALFASNSASAVGNHATCGGGSAWRRARLCCSFLVFVGCGGLAERNEQAGGTPGAPAPGEGGGMSDGGTTAPSCIPFGDAISRCTSRADCCLGMCGFIRMPNPEPGICLGCGVAGDRCDELGIEPSCCSAICASDGHCTCSNEGQPCRAHDNCCSGFCYAERSVCLPTRCDPRVTPSSVPEDCWLGR